MFCSGLVPEDAEAQLRAITRYDQPGGTSVDDFLHHMLRLGDFASELRNRRLEQFLHEPLSAAARAHQWLTAAEGDHPPPPPRPDKDFVASLRFVNGTLECPPQESPNPLPGPARGVLEAPTRRPLPTVDHRARLHDRMGGAHRGGGVGAGVGPVVRRHARPVDPCATIRRHPAPVVGAGHPAETHHDPLGGA